MKARILKTAMYTAKLVPLPLTNELVGLVYDYNSQFSKGASVYFLVFSHPCLLSNISATSSGLLAQYL